MSSRGPGGPLQHGHPQGMLQFLSGFNSYPLTQKGSLSQLSDVVEFFFVAHPESGRKEGEEPQRVMYFHGTADINKQTEITGFAEAVVNFTDNFSEKGAGPPEEFAYRYVNTQKTVHVYLLVEKGEYLIGLGLDRKICADMEYTIFPPTLRTIAMDAYKMFKLFFGTMRSIHNTDASTLRERLQYFFGRYLVQQRLYNMPLLDHFSGVDFQQLHGSVYIQVETLMSELREEFPAVEKILFLYQDKLLYYTTNKNDLPQLFRYLTENLLPMSLRSELEPVTRSGGASSSCGSGKFVTGPANLQSDEPLGEDSPPTVHLASDKEDSLEEYKLVVYRLLNATVCLFCSGTLTRQFLRNVDGFLGAELARLASQIGDAWVFVPRVSQRVDDLRVSDFHYVYFNPCSLSLRTSFHQSTLVGTASDKTPQLPTVPAQVNKLACTSYEKLISSADDFGECFVKDSTDWWVVLKKVSSRILLLLLPPSAGLSTLGEAQLRAHDIVKFRFQGIFLL